MNSGIYAHISPVGKLYIGKSRDFKDRHAGNWITRGYKSCVLFKKAIIKYQQQSFITVYLEHIPTDFDESYFNAREQFYIIAYESNNSTFGYNLTTGGEGGRLNASSCEKIRIAKLGKPRPDVGLRFKGVPLKEETKEKLRLKLRGKKCPHIIKSNKNRALLSEQDKLIAHELLSNNYSYAAVARHFNVTHNVIKYTFGVDLRKGTIGKLRTGASGENNGSARLTKEIALQIRQDNGFQKDLALKYGVSKSTISAIKRNEIWKY